jgi:tRNA U54 and U55 pseudouridine synthase Pus10
MKFLFAFAILVFILTAAYGQKNPWKDFKVFPYIVLMINLSSKSFGIQVRSLAYRNNTAKITRNPRTAVEKT